MIKGNDDLSISILKQLDEGFKPKDIALTMDVSYDQVKKLSQFSSMCQQVKNIISESSYQKLMDLGIKALALKEFFENNELEGLEEVLGSIQLNIRRIDLQKMYSAYIEKKQDIEQMKNRAETKLAELSRREKDIELKIGELKISQESISIAIKVFKIYSIQEQEFLLNHVGVANIPKKKPDSWRYSLTPEEEKDTKSIKVLIKRLDYAWQQKLKKLKVITYDEYNYIWEIPSIDNLIEEYRKRIKNKGRIEYDYNNVPKNSVYNYPEDPYYYSQKIKALNEPLKQKIQSQKEEIKKLEEEKISIETEIRNIRKTDVKTFLDRVELLNTLSTKELYIHGRLQQLSLKYLYERENVAAAEVSYKNYRWDSIGYNKDNHIIIIEVKASAEDFLRDTKWQSYMTFCNRFYFLVETDLSYIFKYKSNERDISKEIEISGAGILIGHKNRLEVIKECAFRNSTTDTGQVIFTINRTISKKLIYGY